MSVSLKQIFSSPISEIHKILGNYTLSGIHAYIAVAEKYAASGQLIEADMYYIHDYHDLFVQPLIEMSKDMSTYGPKDLSINLAIAMKEVQVHNSETIIKAINALILQGNVEEAIRIRRSYNVSESELYDEVYERYQPNMFILELEDDNSLTIFTNYAKVYNLNEPGLLVKKEHPTNYDVLSLFYMFFQDPAIDALSLVDRYFEIYNIPRNRYWYVYSLIVFFAVQNGYTDKFIQKYILDHGSNVEEAEKGDLVMFIFITVVFNTLNGAMYKNLITGYNIAYPDEQTNLDSALTYSIREIFTHYGLDNFNTIYPKVKKPEYLDYGVYSYLLMEIEAYFDDIDGVTPEILRLVENTDHIEEVRRIIYSTSPYTKFSH